MWLGRVWDYIKSVVGGPPTLFEPPDPKWVLGSITPGDEAASLIGTGNRPASELVRRLTGWVSILADRNASACAGVTLRLYQPANSRRRGRKVTDRKTLAHLRASYMGKAASWASNTENIEEVVDHPALELLERPNPTIESGVQFAYQRFYDREWSGSSFVLVIGDGEPAALYRMAPQITRVVLDRRYFIGGYCYGQDASIEQRFGADEVMYSKLRPSPFRPYLGWTWVQSVILDADRYAASTQADYALWTRGGRPDYAFKLPQGTSEAQVKLFREYLANHHQGPANTGRPYVGVAEEIQVLGWSPKDLEGVASRADALQIMASAAGVPMSEINITESNYANSKTGSRRYYELTINPRLVADAAMLTNQLLPRYGIAPGEMWFAYDQTVREEDDAVARRASLLFSGGLYRLNEARQTIGMDEIEGGDRFVWEPTQQQIERQRAELDAENQGQAATIGGPAEAGASGRDVQAEALNGAQVQALTDLVQGVALGRMPIESARAIARAAFPLVPEETLNAIFASLVGFTPTPDPASSPAETQEPAEPGTERQPSDKEREDEPEDGKASKSRHPAYGDGCVHPEGIGTKQQMGDDPYFAPILSAVERWFADSERTVREQAASGSPEAISTDPDALDKEIRPPMQSAMIDAARKAYDAIPGADSGEFAVVPANVVRYMERYVPRLSVAISDETTVKLRDAMREGLVGGESISQIQDRVAAALGEESGYRAERIARTEAASLTTKGNIEGWSAAGVVKKQWQLAPNPCPVCEAVARKNPGPISIDQPFDVEGTGANSGWEAIIGAPAHPNCRCVTLPVL